MSGNNRTSADCLRRAEYSNIAKICRGAFRAPARARGNFGRGKEKNWNKSRHFPPAYVPPRAPLPLLPPFADFCLFFAVLRRLALK